VPSAGAAILRPYFFGPLRSRKPELTKREREVADLVARGQSNKEIAHELGVSEGTVRLILHNVFTKTKVTNRTRLVSRATDAQQKRRRWDRIQRR
jgi:DNA-binding NarL/FixJ family response regulator